MIRFALSILEDSSPEYRLVVKPLIDPDPPVIVGFPQIFNGKIHKFQQRVRNNCFQVSYFSLQLSDIINGSEY